MEDVHAMQILSWGRYSETVESLDRMSIDDFMDLYYWMIAVQQAEAEAQKSHE